MMFGLFKKKPETAKHFTQAEKFEVIDAFEAALMRRGAVAIAAPDFRVRAHFLASCATAAFLNAVAGSNCRPLVDAAFAALRDHLNATGNDLRPEGWVRWANFFNVSPRFIDFNQQKFLQSAPELQGSALTSSGTAYAALMQAFGHDAMNWLLKRKDSDFGLPHATALLCADVMFGEDAEPDIIGDMAVAQAFVEMAQKIMVP